MPVSAAHVVFHQVAKRFGDGPLVLDEVTLEVPAGQFVALIGPSGCGKSTLLRMVAGLSPVTAGELTIDGRPPARGQAGTAFIFQEPTLLPWLNVLHNVEVPLHIRGAPPGERRRLVDGMLRLVRLDDVRLRYPRQLSGGMKMRVSVARALALSPRLLLMDEPFGALDEMTRQHLNEELLELRQAQSWTALFVTHSVAEAVFLSDRVLVLASNPGRVVEEVGVPLPHPRAPALREEPAFHELVGRVSRALRRSGGAVTA